MHLPAAFEMDAGGAFAFIEQYPLAQLVVASQDGLLATPVPLIARGNTLVGHLARANTVWRHAGPALALFTGAQAYVSPNWYPSKHEAHRQVPTWNYEVVHAHGRLTILDDERFVRGLLARLTRHHEAAEPKPWRMGDSAPEFINDLLGKIVGLEVEIASIAGKSKLSQNKEARDRLGAAETLVARGHEELGEVMRKAE